MRLYNLYKEIILEAEIDSEDGTIERDDKFEENKVINKYNSGSVADIIDKLIKGEVDKNGKKFYRSARIWYRDKKTKSLEERYVFIYGEGTLPTSNRAVRAFQAFGGTKTGNSKYKLFLLPGTDKKDGKKYGIQKIVVTDFKWYKPVDKVKGGEGIPKFVGPQDKSFLNGLEKSVTFE